MHYFFNDADSIAVADATAMASDTMPIYVNIGHMKFKELRRKNVIVGGRERTGRQEKIKLNSKTLQEKHDEMQDEMGNV